MDYSGCQSKGNENLFHKVCNGGNLADMSKKLLDYDRIKPSLLKSVNKKYDSDPEKN